MGIFIAYEAETVTKKPDFSGEDSRSIYQGRENEIFPTDPLNTISRNLFCHTSGKLDRKERRVKPPGVRLLHPGRRIPERYYCRLSPALIASTAAIPSAASGMIGSSGVSGSVTCGGRNVTPTRADSSSLKRMRATGEATTCTV